MAIIKNPMVRYQVIHSCLSNKRKAYWSLEELAEKIRARDIAVETRTVAKDIETMRFDEILGYNAPIAYSKKNGGYYYTDPDFSIESFPLTVEDVNALHAGATLLEKYKGSKMMDGLEGLLKKAGNFLKHSEGSLVVNEASPVYSSAFTHLDIVKHAIYEKHALLVTFTNSKEKIVIHPYFLKEVKQKWYVACLPEGEPACRAYEIDTISNIERSDVAYHENTMIDRDTYFKYNYGAQPVNGEILDIELWCSSDIAFLVTHRPFHPGQKLLHDNTEGILISLKLIPTQEFILELFIYGNSIEVKNPPLFRSYWLDTIRRANEDENFVTARDADED